MIRQTALLLYALASPAWADPSIMSFEFPTATYVFKMEDFVAASAQPTNSGEMGLVVDFNTNFPQSFGPFTAGVVGQTGKLRICGEEVSQILLQTEFLVTTVPFPLERPDDAERLADILNARSCGLDAGS